LGWRIILPAMSLGLACATGSTRVESVDGEGGTGGEHELAVASSSTAGGAAAGGAGGEPAFRELRFTFDGGLEGWQLASAGGKYDSAAHIATIGNPGGSIILNGSDIGVVDANPNAWAFRSVDVPEGAAFVVFDTRAQNDAALRVRLVDDSGSSHTVLDWQLLSGGDWMTLTFAVVSWAGQTVTLYFEQDDDGEGVGEHRYVDNVRITNR
jgi:hypothetical protein